MGAPKRQVRKVRARPVPVANVDRLNAALVDAEQAAIELTVWSEVLDEACRQARRLGASWAQVARASGLTPEGARRRWGP